MKRAICIWTPLLIFSLAISLAFAQGDGAVSTLAVPTLVPGNNGITPLDALQTESAVAEIIVTGTLKAGVLYNEPPYSEFTLQGELRGFDIELLRLIAEQWGSEIDFIQVTRQNALEKLVRGDVHLVASAFVNYRDMASSVEFSQTYRVGRQAMMVRANSEFSTPFDLVDRAIGYVIGTRGENALKLWISQTNYRFDLRSYVNLDRAFSALALGEIDAVVAAEQDLLRVTNDFPEMIRILDEAIVSEPHAFALRRQDAPMRNLLNRTLQLFVHEQKLQVLFREFFADETFSEDSITIWDGIGEEVKPALFPAQITYPLRYRLPRIVNGGALRVGGIDETSGIQNAGDRLLAELNRAMISEIASRWGVALEVVPSSAEQAIELLTAGSVDIVVGVKPDWTRGSVIDFSVPYLLHGDRLMVPKSSESTASMTYEDELSAWSSATTAPKNERKHGQIVSMPLFASFRRRRVALR